MISVKERNCQREEKELSVRRRDHHSAPVGKSCGGCTACHQKTGVRSLQGEQSLGGSGSRDGGLNIQKPCAATFFQRNLGNSRMLAMAGRGGHAPAVQRKCSCGGPCGKEEELPVQTKLTVGPADDVYEQEADCVAEQVMRMPASGEASHHQAGITVQHLAGSTGHDTGSDIDLDRSGGRPLCDSTRGFLEPRFGMDFGHVRVHADSEAHRNAAQLQARAFTYGSHVWLGKGENEQNHALMAHELTHVVQQGALKTSLQAPNELLAASGKEAASSHIQRYEVEDCDPAENPDQDPQTVRDAHDRAFAMLNTAVSMCSDLSNADVQRAANRYFKITLPTASPVDTDLWTRVTRALDTMRRADSEAVYECEPEQSWWHGGCISGNVAISLMNIHLCPLWWTAYPTVDERAAVLLHEWGHKWGEGINRIFETYCWEPDYGGLPADTLVQMPDAFAGFVYDLSTGTVMSC